MASQLLPVQENIGESLLNIGYIFILVYYVYFYIFPFIFAFFFACFFLLPFFLFVSLLSHCRLLFFRSAVLFLFLLVLMFSSSLEILITIRSLKRGRMLKSSMLPCSHTFSLFVPHFKNFLTMCSFSTL